MTRHTQQTAAEAYAARRESIEAKLAGLKGGLLAHHKRAAKQPGNWGFPGDLAHDEEILDQALSFLGVAGPEEPR